MLETPLGGGLQPSQADTAARGLCGEYVDLPLLPNVVNFGGVQVKRAAWDIEPRLKEGGVPRGEATCGRWSASDARVGAG